MQRGQQASSSSPVDKKVPGIDLGIDGDYKASGSFSEVMRGYEMGVGCLPFDVWASRRSGVLVAQLVGRCS